MRPSYVTLEQMLDARERRAAIQQEMLEEAGRKNAGSPFCLVCLTLNIAGEIKRTPLTRMLFDRGLADFSALALPIAQRRETDGPTGSEAFFLVQKSGREIKPLLEQLEEAFPAARLFDFDVLQPGGEKLSREAPRRCLVCDAPAAECARSRRHGLPAIKAATDKLLRDFCASELADAAHRALLDELYTTPKPGLVDRMSNGAHTDMDLPLFEKSADSLLPYFLDAARLGMDDCGMNALRARGIEAEAAMFAATGGVNTHKGSIYSMGLLLAGMGRFLTDPKIAESPSAAPDTDDFSAAQSAAYTCIPYAAALAAQDAQERLAFSAAAPVTNGGRALRDYGAKGATGEAMAGFPHAVSCALRLRAYRERGAKNAPALAFCDSLAQLEDTNLLHRGGREGLAYAKKEAARIAGLPEAERPAALAALDGEMIKRNLSPGGSADMLALAFLLERWRTLSAEFVPAQGDAAAQSDSAAAPNNFTATSKGEPQ